MGRRKEIIVAIAVIVLLAVVLIVSQLFRGRSQYDRDDVMLNFSTEESNHTVEDEPASSDEMGDFTMPFIQSSEDDALDGVVQEDPVYGYVSGNEDVATPDGPTGKYPTNPTKDEDHTSGEQVSGEQGGQTVGGEADSGDIDNSVELNELRASAVAYFVCGLEDMDAFNSLMTEALVASFGSQSNSEPYKTLSGNIGFSKLTLVNNIVSFVADSGVEYSFSLEFDGDRISSITYMQ